MVRGRHWSIDAVVFDMDGVLIDSEPLWRRAEIEVLRPLGVPLTEAMCAATMGLRIDDVVAFWRARFPWKEPDNPVVAERVMVRVTHLIRRHGQPLPGAPDAVRAVGGAGLGVGLASSSAHGLIAAVLERLGLETAFDVCCSALDERHGKPAPDVYLSAARKLGVAPSRCLAVEDSPSGLAAARAAGMQVVLIPEAGSTGWAGADRPDRTLPSLLAFDPAHWCRNGLV
jgi:sugar-phosphatase